MRILCITHADFESPGIIETWARENGSTFRIVKPYQGDTLPTIDDVDFLIVMGGPQSGTKCEEFPYLFDEIALIKTAIDKKKRVLGFCLGAQLIGEALGAPTERSPEKEVGVYPIHLTQAGKTDALLEGLPAVFDVIHWHNDMPGLLPDSELLAYSEGCPRQIVRYRPQVYGFQCHLEIPLEGIEIMIAAVPEDLKPSRYTQSAEALLLQDYDAINQRMITILDRFMTL